MQHLCFDICSDKWDVHVDFLKSSQQLGCDKINGNKSQLGMVQYFLT